ncbi:MAG: hypothetical protein QF472_00755 [Candidatus Marinimicrobia bacterium]|nr:hypothetical protein [Candidatus Neomarinimicrobiota bacterium]MDP6852458.1 hypothetical protein [Candidatus Neomarinimicrobiota bacterium]
MGKGEQEIVAIDPGNRIDYEPDLEEDRLLSEIPKRVKCYSEVHRH